MAVPGEKPMTVDTPPWKRAAPASATKVTRARREPALWTAVGDRREVVSEALVTVQRHRCEARDLIACEPAGVVEVSRRRPWLVLERDDEDPTDVPIQHVIPELPYRVGRDPKLFTELANYALLGCLSRLDPTAYRLPVPGQALLAGRASCDEDLVVVVTNDDCATGGDPHGSSAVYRLNLATTAPRSALSQMDEERRADARLAWSQRAPGSQGSCGSVVSLATAPSRSGPLPPPPPNGFVIASVMRSYRRCGRRGNTESTRRTNRLSPMTSTHRASASDEEQRSVRRPPRMEATSPEGAYALGVTSTLVKRDDVGHRPIRPPIGASMLGVGGLRTVLG